MQSRSIIWVIIVILVGASIYLFYASGSLSPSRSSAEESALANLPIETEGILERKSSVYREEGVVQHTVVFSTSKSKEELWTTYLGYVEREGYMLDIAHTSQADGVIQAKKPGEILNILIYAEGEALGQRVAISYLSKRLLSVDK